jgi:hypothetical protein
VFSSTDRGNCVGGRRGPAVELSRSVTAIPDAPRRETAPPPFRCLRARGSLLSARASHQQPQWVTTQPIRPGGQGSQKYNFYRCPHWVNRVGSMLRPSPPVYPGSRDIIRPVRLVRFVPAHRRLRRMDRDRSCAQHHSRQERLAAPQSSFRNSGFDATDTRKFRDGGPVSCRS